MGLVFRRCELAPDQVFDVKTEGAFVKAIKPTIDTSSKDQCIDVAGGAVLPPLSDHHIHLRATAASRLSIQCGPPSVFSRESLAAALATAPGDGWIRGVGFDESAVESLDRYELDELCPARPVRIQHRTGKMWYLNSSALGELNMPEHKTGQLFRGDTILREVTMASTEVHEQVKLVAAELLQFGVMSVTDATPTNEDADEISLQDAAKQLHVSCMGSFNKTRGYRKLLLDEAQLPDWSAFVDEISIAHDLQRPLAIHAVTRVENVFALTALQEAGCGNEDRIEHASELDDPTLDLLVETGVSVAVQPSFIYERGDRYADFSLEVQKTMYRTKALMDAGVPLVGSSDAPYGNLNPWLSMRTAVARSTATGQSFQTAECISPEAAFNLFSSQSLTFEAPWLSIGDSANFCICDRPWNQIRTEFSAEHLLGTVQEGVPHWC